MTTKGRVRRARTDRHAMMFSAPHMYVSGRCRCQCRCRCSGRSVVGLNGVDTLAETRKDALTKDVHARGFPLVPTKRKVDTTQPSTAQHSPAAPPCRRKSQPRYKPSTLSDSTPNKKQATHMDQNNHLRGQLLAELHPPLVERVQPPHETLHRRAVLVGGQQLPAGEGVELREE